MASGRVALTRRFASALLVACAGASALISARQTPSAPPPPPQHQRPAVFPGIPTFVYVEDNLNGQVEHLLLCGFGPQLEDEARQRFPEELRVSVEPLRSPLATPGENNAGLLGYLRSIAKNN